MKLRFAPALLTATLLLPAAVKALPVVAYELNSINGGAGGGNYNYTMGFLFQADQELLVTDLGLYDQSFDGFAASHQVGLWELTPSGLVLRRSASFGAGQTGTLQGMFRYSDIEDYTLAAGSRYVLAASNYALGGGDIAAGAWLTNVEFNGITYLGGRWGSSSTPGDVLHTPNISYNTDNFMWYASANFIYDDGSPAPDAVPEPSTTALMILGTGMLLVAGRRRFRKG